MSTRNKLIDEVLRNMEEWLSGNEGVYRRKKGYGLNYGAMRMEEVVMPKEHVSFMENLARLAAR